MSSQKSKLNNSNSIDESSLDVDGAIKVCKIREDGALAQRLQTEEELYHYSRNVEERKLAAYDLKKAKELQAAEDKLFRERQRKKEIEDQRRAKYLQEKLDKEEKEKLRLLRETARRDEKEAQILAALEKQQKQFDQMQMMKDQKLAEQLAAKLNTKPSNIESSDERLARVLQEDERRMMLEEEREREKLRKTALLKDEELARHYQNDERRRSHQLEGHMKNESKKKISKRSPQLPGAAELNRNRNRSVPSRPEPTYSSGLNQGKFACGSNRSASNRIPQSSSSRLLNETPVKKITSSSPQRPPTSSTNNSNIYGSRLHDNDKDMPIDEDAYQQTFERFVSENNARSSLNYKSSKNKSKNKSDCKQQ